MNPYFLAGYCSGAFSQSVITVLVTSHYGAGAGILTAFSLAALSLYMHVKMGTAGEDE